MVKHIIFWTLKPEKKADAAEITKELNAKFKGLLGVVDGLTEIEVGHNYSGGAYDLALNCTFTTKEAEKGYQTHPGHVAIKEIVHTLVNARECMDYEI
jgi:hypothetical protein